MRHNVKTPLWMMGLLAALAWPALADGPKALDVTAADLAAAGVSDATHIAPIGDRFAPPVAYFRSPETLSAADARKDCADCGDLIAVYVAETPVLPSWNGGVSQQFIRMGGRLQLRAYVPSTRRVVTVTAPSEQTLRKISRHLVDKFSR